jgi:hypothetical protein
MGPSLRSALAVVPFAASFLLGCAGNVSASAHWTGDPKEEVRPLRDVETLTPGEKPMAESGAPATTFGVRHDLWLADSAERKASCACLTIAVGPATDMLMSWRDGAPDIGVDGLAFAMSPTGVDCANGPADVAARRPSISAVDMEDGDVVVEIEDLPEGRPLAWGAVLPKPEKGKRVYVRPKNAKTPYGRAFGLGVGRCQVYERRD